MSVILCASDGAGGLQYLEEQIRSNAPQEKILEDLQVIKDDFLNKRFMAEDYFYDRKGQLVRKDNDGYTPVVFLQ